MYPKKTRIYRTGAFYIYLSRWCPSNARNTIKSGVYNYINGLIGTLLFHKCSSIRMQFIPFLATKENCEHVLYQGPHC